LAVVVSTFGLFCYALAQVMMRSHPSYVELPDGRRYLRVKARYSDRTADVIRKKSIIESQNAAHSGPITFTLGDGLGRPERNCSVVGNDSSMRKSGLGKIIDSAEAVYRMNFAPLENFGADVGLRTHTQCINPEKLRLLVSTNTEFMMDTGEKPRVMVVGDASGTDPVTGSKGPCVEFSPGGTCVRRVDNPRPQVIEKHIQEVAESLLDTLQDASERGEAVPSTGMYCLCLALMECSHVEVFGMGVGTINHKDLSDLEYFKDPYFHGWDARHDTEMERALMRILSSRMWDSHLVAGFGKLHWNNPLKGINVGANNNLVAQSPCTSGIHC